jgi:quinol monooxygenase YgiN
MSRQIQYILEWTITRGQQGAFKKLALAAIEAAKADEPGTLGYQWYFSKDESKCYVAESYADAGSMMTHLENVAPVLSEFFKLSAITRFEVFGNLTSKAEKALAPLRAQTFDHWSGFTR